MDCIFCKIADREIENEIIYEDDKVIAFPDIEPQAPHHLLVIPRQHIATLNDLSGEHTGLVGHMVEVAKNIAQERGIAQSGYRLVLNCNRGGGQAVFHIHLHLLGGRQMKWPPG